MWNKISCSLLCFFLCLSLVKAQDSEVAQYECLYRLRFSKDTIQNTYAEDLMILRFNHNRSIFYSETTYLLDSLLLSDQADAVRQDLLVNGRRKYGKRVVSYYVLKDFAQRKIEYADNVGGDRYQYEEDLPRLEWEITPEQKTISDYTCQKAVCDFRGRKYIAWFTPEVAVQNGPWKFQGLPGLILEVYDTAEHYKFTFAGLRASGASIQLPPYDYVKSTRKEYLKVYRNYLKDPVAFISASTGINVSLSPDAARKLKAKKSAKYDPMERDYK